MNRAKGNRLERYVMRLLVAVDGACPILGGAASSTGRLGHLTELQLDGATERLGVETKNRESLPDWPFDAVEQIRVRAGRFHKLGVHVIKKNRRRPVVLIDLDDFATLLERRERGAP